MTTTPLNPDTGWVRYLGILTAVALCIFTLSNFLLPSRAGGIVGGLALLLAVGAGVQFFFHGATLISMTLTGQRRMQFQVVVSLAVPALFAVALASQVDAMPVATLGRMITPWLLLPVGIIAYSCWVLGAQLNRDHPFRGFVVAAIIFGVVCWFWSFGMTTGWDDDGEGGDLYLDPEKAKRARATGEYVWRFLVYVSVAYLALFSRLLYRR